MGVTFGNVKRKSCFNNWSWKDNRSAFSIREEWIKYPEDVVDLAIFLAGQPDIGPTAQSFSLMRRDIF